MAEAEGPPSREEFVQEVIDALRGAGVEGAIDYDDTLGSLMHSSGIALAVHALFEQLGHVSAENRKATLANYAQAVCSDQRIPSRWEDASPGVLPGLHRQMALAVEESRRSARERPVPIPFARLTPHLALRVVYPVGRLTSLIVPGETYAAWGVDPDVVFRTAAQNLLRRSDGPWQETQEAPGMVRSPWRDGFDASRLMLPQLFARVPQRGRPVVVAPAPSMLLWAGSESEEGLLSLARFARRVFEREKTFFFLRPLRMGADGESWEDWVPAREHPAYAELRLLRAIEEKADYDLQAHLTGRLAGVKSKGAPLPPFAIVYGSGPTFTLTRWKAGPPVALPKADAILFQREDEVLGFAWWEDVLRALPGELDSLPSYPPRHRAADFPEPWQTDALDLKPWPGPPPE